MIQSGKAMFFFVFLLFFYKRLLDISLIVFFLTKNKHLYLCVFVMEQVAE